MHRGEVLSRAHRRGWGRGQPENGSYTSRIEGFRLHTHDSFTSPPPPPHEHLVIHNLVALYLKLVVAPSNCKHRTTVQLSPTKNIFPRNNPVRRLWAKECPCPHRKRRN